MNSTTPLVIDLDGTLLRSDLLLETGLQFIAHHPYRVDLPVRWLMQGKPILKHHLAQNTDIDIEHLPFNQTVLNFITQAKQENRKIILATASDRLLADKVAAYLGVFDEVLATENNTNLSGRLKAIGFENVPSYEWIYLYIYSQTTSKVKQAVFRRQYK